MGLSNDIHVSNPRLRPGGGGVSRNNDRRIIHMTARPGNVAIGYRSRRKLGTTLRNEMKCTRNYSNMHTALAWWKQKKKGDTSHLELEIERRVSAHSYTLQYIRILTL